MGITNGLLISNELNINSEKIEKIENLKKQWDTPVEGSDKFFQKISDDQKYFWPNSEETAEKCQEEFNNLSISEVKEKKWFYEQCKNKPADYEENPDKYKDTPYGMFKNSMKKFDEVKNILVDISWRFITVIIIDCIVFISICSCIIFAIHSYNKNAAQQVPLQVPQNELNINDSVSIVQSGLRENHSLKEGQLVDANELERAIANGDIIIRPDDNFNNIPGFKPDEYTDSIKGNDLFGNAHWFRIAYNYFDNDMLISLIIRIH